MATVSAWVFWAAVATVPRRVILSFTTSTLMVESLRSSAVARAAQMLIRDELRADRDKQKAMRAEKRDLDAEGGRSTKRDTQESARRQVGPSRACKQLGH